MKQIRYIAIMAAAILSAACTKEMKGPEETELTVTASFAEESTRTVLNGGSVLWEPGDEVKLFYDGTGSRLTSTNSEPVGVASFRGTFNGVINFNEGFSASTPLWGLYPYRADATADNTSVTTTLLSEQTGKAGSFAKGMNISLAKSNSLAMGFYNVCGGVRFSVTRNDVKNVVFEALNGESIAGRVKLAFEGGVPTVQEVSDGQKSITLTAPAGGPFETGKWYYIVTLPGNLSGGFKMTFNTDTKYAVLKSTDSRTISRSKFGSLADADEDLVYKDKGTPEPGEGNIVFKDPIAKYACVEKFDTDGDGEVSYDEAAAVTSIAGLFTDYNTVTSFDELKYFTKITNLGSAMKGLASLKSVTIPAAFTSLENYAFDGCSVLDSITFAGNSVSSVGASAFRFCAALKELDLPSGLTSIGAYSFSGCTKLGAIDFPSSLNTIGNYAFQNCKAIISVSVPNTVTSFGSNVFDGCSSVENASLPSGLTSIPSGTFSGCTFLCHFTFPEGVTTIGDDAFRYCTFFDKATGVAKIELPSTVTTIGSRAFSNAQTVLVTSSSSVSIQSNTFSVGTRIFVPDAKVEPYKIRTNWSKFANYIFPLSSYSDEPFEMESVDLGLSVKWATCNLGAYSSEQYGTYYAWGDVKGQLWGDGWSGGVFSIYPTYELDSNNNLKPEYDAAHVNISGSWRMPTKSEFLELKDNCISTWTADYDGTGVSGTIFTSKKDGYTDKSIFLPAAGAGYNSKLLNAGTFGYYWTSTFSSSDSAWDISCVSDYVSTSSHGSNIGQSIRPVCE